MLIYQLGIKRKHMKKTLITLIFITSSISAPIQAEGNHKGGHQNTPSGGHWMSPEADSAKPNPIKRDKASINRGKQSYFQYCSACHGAQALGNGPAGMSLKPKPANLKAMAGGHPDGDFAWKIANGRGAMPSWKNTLNENQIWDLVNYIQNLNPKGRMMDMSKMDHTKMSMNDMKKMMPNMDHSNMKSGEMKQMMAKMKGVKDAEHSNSDGHHNPKPQNSHDKPHSH